MKKVIFIIAALCYLPIYLLAQSVNIVPMVNSLEKNRGSFEAKEVFITPSTPTLAFEHDFLLNKINLNNYGVKLTSDKSRSATVKLKIDNRLKGSERYILDINKKSITITGSDRAGVFYGVQSLLQIMESGDIATCTIDDAPRYHWRGFMVDESRHFFGFDKIKETLDMMARYKLNKFHWHLTDESAWRIEIKSYPKLSTVGAVGSWSDPHLKAQAYSQEEIREIVAYAAQRHIEIIPEIDMPGHATAANRAYPYLSGGGVPAHPDFTFNPGKEEVYDFVKSVLTEVAELFPSKYIHIGGDEVAFGIKAWQSDPHVQALMQREGMTDVRQAERYFIARTTAIINNLNKELIGWDELLDIDADPKNTTIMWWRHDRIASLEKSLKRDYKTVLSPRRPMYFDFIQHKDDKWGRTWGGYCPLEDVYAFPDNDIAGWEVSNSDMENILGVQANLWSERIQNIDRYDYMTYPRFAALSESGWTNKDTKSFSSFEQRMQKEYALYDSMDIYYFDHRNPSAHPEPKGCEKPNIIIPLDFKD